MQHAIYRLIFLQLSVLYTKKMGAIGYVNEQDIRNNNIDKISDKNRKGNITQEKFTTVIFKGNRYFEKCFKLLLHCSIVPPLLLYTNKQTNRKVRKYNVWT